MSGVKSRLICIVARSFSRNLLFISTMMGHFPKPQHTTPQCPVREVTHGRRLLTAGHQVHDCEYLHQGTKEARVMWSGKLFLAVRMTSADVLNTSGCSFGAVFSMNIQNLLPLRFYFPQSYNCYPNQGEIEIGRLDCDHLVNIDGSQTEIKFLFY